MRRSPEIDWQWATACTCAKRVENGRCPGCLVRIHGAALAEDIVRRRAAEHTHAGHSIERLPPSIITGAFGWVCSCGHTWTVTKAQVLADLVIVVQP